MVTAESRIKVTDKVTKTAPRKANRAKHQSTETRVTHTIDTRHIRYVAYQFTPNQVRSPHENGEEAAERRLQADYFTDDRWELLPALAKQALISADRTFVDSTYGRRAAILNELRIAMEEVLHHHFWKPLVEWARGQQGYEAGPDFRGTRTTQGHLGSKRPSLDNYEKEVLPDMGTRRFLREIGLNGESPDFKGYIERLRKTRNTAEHTADRAEVDALYAEAVGIGQRGVLPELVRLLGKRTSSPRLQGRVTEPPLRVPSPPGLTPVFVEPTHDDAC